MYHIPWLSLVALLDLLPSFKMINADKNSSMKKKCLSLCLRICVTDRFKNVSRIKPTRLQALVKCSN